MTTDTLSCAPAVLADYRPGQRVYLLRKGNGYEPEEVLVKAVGRKIITVESGKRFYISEMGYPLAADVHEGPAEQEMLCSDMAHVEAVRTALQACARIAYLLSYPLYIFSPGRLEQIRKMLEKDVRET